MTTRRTGSGPDGSGRTVAGAGLVVLSCCAVQSSAVVSTGLFGSLGVAEVAGLRQLVGAVVLVLAVRPRVRDRPARQWGLVLLFGACIATMNVAFYQSLDRLPLGVAATLLYLGPFTLAALGIRRRWEITLPVLALVGVALVSRPTGDVSAPGVLLGLIAAAALAVYTVTSRRAGRTAGGLDVLSLAVVFSALMLAPFSVGAVREVSLGQWPPLLYAGAVGVALAFACDLVALRLAGVRLVSTLFALDPVIGSVLGVVLLGDVISPAATTGIVVICVVGAVVTGLSTHDGSTDARPAHGSCRRRDGPALEAADSAASGGRPPLRGN